MSRNSMCLGTVLLAMVMLTGIPAFITPADAQTHIYVDQVNGINNTATEGTISTPFKSITYAMLIMNNRAAPDPWVIHLRAGSYDTNTAKPANQQEIFPITLREGMTIQGEDGAENCIISGAYMTASVPLIKANDLSDIHIIGITLSDNTRNPSANGGGAEIINCSGSIQGCIVRNNSSSVSLSASGGGIFLSIRPNGNFNIIDNVFLNNRTHSDGGGVWVSGDFTGEISGNTFKGNLAEDTSNGTNGGGGFYVTGNFYGSIIGNNFIANVCNAKFQAYGGYEGQGAGFRIRGRMNGDIAGNFFLENKSYYGYGGGFHVGSIAGNIVENVFTGNISGRDEHASAFASGTLTGNIMRNIFSVNRPNTANYGTAVVLWGRVALTICLQTTYSSRTAILRYTQIRMPRS